MAIDIERYKPALVFIISAVLKANKIPVPSELVAFIIDETVDILKEVEETPDAEGFLGVIQHLIDNKVDGWKI